LSKYLITGAAGFIGSNLAEFLLQSGNDIVSIDNLDPFYPAAVKEENLSAIKETASINKAGFFDIRGDIRNSDLLSSAFKEHSFDGVYHLAAMAGIRPSLKDPVRYWDVNCTGTATLLEAVRKSGIKRFVYASSSSVYGNCRTVPFKENLFVGKPVSPYAATKRAGELLCYNYSHLYGINTVCIRYFTVYGPRQRPDLAIHKFSKLILEGKPVPFYGDGTSERDYTYITDIVSGTVKAMAYAESCAYDIINLGESSTISLKELLTLLQNKLGKKADIQRLPMQPGDVLRTWADVSKAKEKLGYEPAVTKEEGIDKFITWLKNRP